MRAVLSSLFLLAALAQAAPVRLATPDAAKAVADARAKAKRERKNVMVVFHASWCGWCKRMDAMLNDAALKPRFEGSYVIVRLDVAEAPEKKGLENPGGSDVLAALGGKDSGLPFFAVLSPDGKKLADSLAKPGEPSTNVGHPATEPEIAHFMDVLKTTARRMSDADRERVLAYLKADDKS